MFYVGKLPRSVKGAERRQRYVAGWVFGLLNYQTHLRFRDIAELTVRSTTTLTKGAPCAFFFLNGGDVLMLFDAAAEGYPQLLVRCA